MDSNRETGKLQRQMQEPKATGVRAVRADTEGPHLTVPSGVGGSGCQHRQLVCKEP